MSQSDIAIRIEGLGKKYKLGETHQAVRNFRETLMTLPRMAGRKAKKTVRHALSHRQKTGSILPQDRSGPQNMQTRDQREGAHADPTHVLDPREKDGWFWALKDINLEVKRGEAVGIIGRNGAGKSTLLKVLSRITQPTEGHAEIRGRVGALLEVGTGMHPELTGRENIYLNGSILGMHRSEINAKFDEIVDFAGVEKFLDTPLKRYSSGMRVRLGFSVAAHLEPEILIVDEVLSVGDAEFRKKCLGKMDEVTSGGRTVLFVSHNLAMIRVLCKEVAILGSGNLLYKDRVDRGIKQYTTIINEQADLKAADRKDREGDGRALVEDIWLEDYMGNKTEMATSGDRVAIAFQASLQAESRSFTFSLGLYDSMGVCISHLSTQHGRTEIQCESSAKMVCARCLLPSLPLPQGEYFINVSITSNGKRADRLERALGFSVESGDFFGTGALPPSSFGQVLIQHEWTLKDA